MKDNKIIAEFMKTSIGYGNDYYTDDKFPYKTSWDWLMPVVQKIMDVSFFNGEPEDFYSIRNSIPQIRNTYKAVVEFIKLYNKDES